MEFDDNACNFMRRWAEVIALLGTQVVEDWAYFEGRGPVALKAFDLLVQANALAAAHPSRVGQTDIDFNVLSPFSCLLFRQGPSLKRFYAPNA